MDRVVSTFVAQDLTGVEETDLLKGKATMKLYSQLVGVRDIVSFLQPLNKVALFFPVGNNASTPGHWLAVWYDPQSRTIHHFDSYGFGPEAELRYSHNTDVQEQLLNKLYQQAQQQGYNLVWNKTAFQQMGDNVNTCGRHVVVRLLFSYLSEDQYTQLLTGQKMSPDDLVTLMTLISLDETQQVGQILRSL